MAGIRYWFLTVADVSLGSSLVRLARKNVLVRYAGLAVLLLTTIGIVRKWSYPPLLPETHFSADVERFKNLKDGEHMLFSVYDPWGRKMELIKH